MHVNNASREDQERWLEHRAWQRKQNLKDMWRHPDTGIAYHFNAAIKLAKEDCRLDPDFQVPPK